MAPLDGWRFARDRAASQAAKMLGKDDDESIFIGIAAFNLQTASTGFSCDYVYKLQSLLHNAPTSSSDRASLFSLWL